MIYRAERGPDVIISNVTLRFSAHFFQQRCEKPTHFIDAVIELLYREHRALFQPGRKVHRKAPLFSTARRLLAGMYFIQSCMTFCQEENVRSQPSTAEAEATHTKMEMVSMGRVIIRPQCGAKQRAAAGKDSVQPAATVALF